MLLSDPRVAAVPVHDSGEPLTELDESFGSSCALVRVSVARRLALARAGLPEGLGLRVIEGYRTAAAQHAIIRSYADEIRVSHPAVGAAELERLTSRFVAPMAVAPHVAGAAVDLTLVDSGGRELDLGTPVDATPEQSSGACYFDAPLAGRHARANRELLAQVLRGAGLVNYPTEWWHWSYGDRYWALMAGATAAVYGPVGRTRSPDERGRGARRRNRSDCAQGAMLTVDLAAVAATPDSSPRAKGEVMAVVKADGFGHGCVPAARTALENGATWLGVTSIAEGLALREAGFAAPMLAGSTLWTPTSGPRSRGESTSLCPASSTSARSRALPWQQGIAAGCTCTWT